MIGLLLLISAKIVVSHQNDPSQCSQRLGVDFISSWYDGSSFDPSTNVWADKTGNGNDGFIYAGRSSGIGYFDGSDSANTELYLNGEPSVSGTEATSFQLGSLSVTEDSTVFNLCKYRDDASHRGRIIDADTNVLFGHWGDRSGVCHWNRWITPTNNVFGRDWVLSSVAKNVYRGNGLDQWNDVTGTAAPGKLYISYREQSDWACAEVLVVNNVILEMDEIKCIEEYFSCKYDLGLDGANCDVCETLDCDDNNACTVDSCDGQTGCFNARFTDECDDGDACTIDTCDEVTGCSNVPKDCGVDVCVDGVCKQDCDVLDIDGFLTDCSSEWVATNDEINSRIGDIEAILAEHGVVFDKLAAAQSEGNAVNMLGEFGEGARDEFRYLSMQHKDNLIIFLLVVNMLLVVGACVQCCLWRKSKHKYAKYDNVRAYSSHDENQQLQSE